MTRHDESCFMCVTSVGAKMTRLFLSNHPLDQCRFLLHDDSQGSRMKSQLAYLIAQISSTWQLMYCMRVLFYRWWGMWALCLATLCRMRFGRPLQRSSTTIMIREQEKQNNNTQMIKKNWLPLLIQLCYIIPISNCVSLLQTCICTWVLYPKRSEASDIC